MAAKRRPREVGASTPAQQDEADIVAEVGAEHDEEQGELLADAAKIREIGAVDAESVRENRRLADIVGKKRANIKDVPFNVGDLLTKYETLIKFWPVNTLDISVKRLTGSPIEHVITSRPRSAAELFEALKAVHGQHEEAKYAIKIFDNNTKEFRGNGQITLPDTRPSQQGPYMNTPQYPYAPQYPQQMFAPAPPQQPQQPQQPQSLQAQAPAPAPPTVQFVPPAGPDPLAMMQQMFQMFQQMQPPAQPAQPAPAQHARGREQPQPQPQPQQTHPMAAMMAMMGAPPIQPPPGTIWVPGFGFVPLERLSQVVSGVGDGQERRGPGFGPAYRPSYRDRVEGPPPHSQYAPQPPPQRERTAAEQFRDAMTIMRTAVTAVQEFSDLVPGQGVGEAAHHAPPSPEIEEDSPVQVIDTGPAKLVVDKKSGTLRGWETGWANMDKIFKWAGEQREAIQRAHAEHEHQQRPQRQLPPGYVEVSPGYQPPPGYVAVPVEENSGFPPPPQDLRPIQPTPDRVWGPPSIPEDGR